MKKLINAVLVSTVFSATVSMGVARAEGTLVCDSKLCQTLDANALKPSVDAQRRSFMFLTYNYAIADKLSTLFHQSKTRISQGLNDRQDDQLVKFVETISTQKALNTIYYYTHIPGADVVQLAFRFKTAADELTRKPTSSPEERKTIWLKAMKDFEANQNKWLAQNPGSSYGTKFLYTHAMNGMYLAFTNEDGQVEFSISEAATYMKSIFSTLLLLWEAEKFASETNR